LPKCDWVYFATPSRWSGTVTAKFVATHRVIVRNVYNSMGIRIANVRHLKPGEKILLVHGGDGRPYRALFCGRIGASSNTVRTPQHTFAAFSYIDSALDSDLSSGGYTRDPVLNRFTGITLESSIDLSHITGQIPRPEGNNTIWRWRTVFGGK
jgi:hypothetical protein